VRLPERGRIGIFNRSYYEEVLITRVHTAILDTQNLPKQSRVTSISGGSVSFHRRIGGAFAPKRHPGHQILPEFIKREQAKRFLERIDEPDKNWKVSASDIHERKYWKHYMRAYGQCLAETSTRHAPWYAVPADDKENARLIVSQILIDASIT